MRNIPKNKTERLTAVLQDLGFRFNLNGSVYLDNQLIINNLGRLSPNLAKPQNVVGNCTEPKRKHNRKNDLRYNSHNIFCNLFIFSNFAKRK